MTKSNRFPPLHDHMPPEEIHEGGGVIVSLILALFFGAGFVAGLIVGVLQ